MNKPLVSVIIPLYNSEKYIAETIQSVLNQTYQNIEVIIINDHSIDASAQIVGSINSKKIRLYNNKNKGACAARNYGFELSKGDFIQYLDADDILSNTKIENQISLIEEKKRDVVYSCSFSRFKLSPKIDAALCNQIIDKSYVSPLDWLLDSWLGNGMGQTSIWLISRDLHSKAGRWNENLSKNQDGDFFCRVLLCARELCYVKDSMVYYRISGIQSISQKVTYSSVKSTFDSYCLYQEYTRGIEHSKLNLALANCFYTFINHYYPNYEELCLQAEKKMIELGYNFRDLNKGSILSSISTLIGFKRTLKLRLKIKKLKSSYDSRN